MRPSDEYWSRMRKVAMTSLKYHGTENNHLEVMGENYGCSGMKIAGIGNDSTALANKTTKNSPVVGNSEINVLYIATLFETIIFFRLDSTPHIFLPGLLRLSAYVIIFFPPHGAA